MSAKVFTPKCSIFVPAAVFFERRLIVLQCERVRGRTVSSLV